MAGSCPKCGGYMKKKGYVRKSEKRKGASEAYQCKDCGYRQTDVEKFG